MLVYCIGLYLSGLLHSVWWEWIYFTPSNEMDEILHSISWDGWNWSPLSGCMRQVLRPVALGRPKGIEWKGRWEEGSGWGIHVNPCLIHVNEWQKPLQYCKIISLQLIKINERERDRENLWKSSLPEERFQCTIIIG